MAKRRADSQIDNLIPNYQKSGIAWISLHAGGVQHIIEFFLTRATTLF
jgi:hypothetical protein